MNINPKFVTVWQGEKSLWREKSDLKPLYWARKIIQTIKILIKGFSFTFPLNKNKIAKKGQSFQYQKLMFCHSYLSLFCLQTCAKSDSCVCNLFKSPKHFHFIFPSFQQTYAKQQRTRECIRDNTINDNNDISIRKNHEYWIRCQFYILFFFHPNNNNNTFRVK